MRNNHLKAERKNCKKMPLEMDAEGGKDVCSFWTNHLIDNYWQIPSTQRHIHDFLDDCSLWTNH